MDWRNLRHRQIDGDAGLGEHRIEPWAPLRQTEIHRVQDVDTSRVAEGRQSISVRPEGTGGFSRRGNRGR